jgi:hypothetical protein
MPVHVEGQVLDDESDLVGTKAVLHLGCDLIPRCAVRTLEIQESDNADGSRSRAETEILDLNGHLGRRLDDRRRE